MTVSFPAPVLESVSISPFPLGSIEAVTPILLELMAAITSPIELEATLAQVDGGTLAGGIGDLERARAHAPARRCR